MRVIWSNTLKASNQSEAEKVLAYAKEHCKKRGLEDYDEQTMCGLEFAEDSLIYTEFRKDSPCAQLQPFPEIPLVQLQKCFEGHVEIAFALVQKLPFPFQSFPFGKKSALYLPGTFARPVVVVNGNVPLTVFIFVCSQFSSLLSAFPRSCRRTVPQNTSG